MIEILNKLTGESYVVSDERFILKPDGTFLDLSEYELIGKKITAVVHKEDGSVLVIYDRM